MSDDLPERICTVPPFDDGDKELTSGCLLVVACVLVVIASFLPRGATKKPEKVDAERPRIVTVCSGCGSEWVSIGEGPHKPITKCPNCPMSEEEWERLTEEVRKQLEEKE